MKEIPVIKTDQRENGRAGDRLKMGGSEKERQLEKKKKMRKRGPNKYSNVTSVGRNGGEIPRDIGWS